MLEPVHIRPATPADISVIARLAQTSPYAAHWSEAQYAEMFSARTILIIEDHDTIHGIVVAQTSTPDWELENIVVAQSHQRRRLATQLLEKLIDQGQAAGATSIFLEVRASNETACAFYEHRGFRRSGRRRNYYVNPSEDAILYRLDLLP